DRFRIVYVGRLSRRKGQHALALLEAFRAFAREGHRVRLDILGDGTMLPEVRRVVAGTNRGAGGDIAQAHGAVPDPASIVGNAHLVVGASYAALEAIMQGVAVVGAGFWGFGPVSAENLFDAMKTNFGDSGGGWPMSPENFLAEVRRLHQVWGGGDAEARQQYWRLHPLIQGIHSIPPLPPPLRRDL